MAGQPETPTYDATVYQYEVTDPVQGGVGGIANQPLKNLADRTAYLKQLIDSLVNGSLIPPTVAPLLGPAFQGSPTAPNVAPGNDSLLIANTDFVQTAKHGLAFVPVGGGVNVTLTQPQWGVAMLIFTGVLTNNISVLFPAQAGNWIVQNATTGGFSLTCKTVSGSGILVPQSAPFDAIWCDGTNINPQVSPFLLSLTMAQVIAALGFTPVQQGGGTNQLTDKVYIGWSAAGRLRLQVDTADQGNFAMEGVTNTFGPQQTFMLGLQAMRGSTGIPNQFQVPVLADFFAGSNSLGWWFSLPAFGITPSNVVMVVGGGIGAPGDGIQRTYPFPRQFPTLCAGMVISYGSSVPPSQGAIGAQPLNAAGFTALNSSLQGGSNGCNYIAVGW